MNVAVPNALQIKAGDAERGAMSLPGRAAAFPELRYMGSKKRLLPWIHGVLQGLDFETAMDPFSGSGSVAYLMKAMGRRVVATDFLNVSATVAKGLVENSKSRIDADALDRLLSRNDRADTFIERTFTGVFFRPEDLRFLDRVSANLTKLECDHQRALAVSALVRSCLKKQPRGVFTISGDPARYDDGRRDLRLSIEQHFLEQVAVYNEAVFSNALENRALRCDVFDADAQGIDLVYLDPPYVPRADDNCYIKRYHFVEGLSVYWKDLDIMEGTKVKKIAKRYTPFSYRSQAEDAFDRMFARFRRQTIVMSYSSNGFPDLEQLTILLRKYKRNVEVYTRPHRYHFGTHVAVKRASVDEYLIVGR
ncbi:DNA adenine methylase [Methylobacterium sp. WL103]|uniref:DNA adenine methylase n=1 Tax=Methylobacterium sp. WL103 TaxID=2603891 RepID=UPI001FEEB677|nr:DNA adenine methylase [Methylobacterium sp. WL103]